MKDSNLSEKTQLAHKLLAALEMMDSPEAKVDLIGFYFDIIEKSCEN